MAMDRDAHADDATAPAGWTCVAEHGFTGLSLGAYLRALEVWLTVPEHVNRSILRADMLHDSTKSSGSTTASVVTAIDIHPATTTVLEVLLEPQSPEDAQQDVRMTRHILRRLVPRVHRDTNTMMQALWCANVSRTVRDDNGRTHTVHKWHVTQHRADPEAGEHVDEGDLQFGFFHPPARDFALCFEHKVGAGSGHEDAVAEDAETTLYNGRLCVVARPFASALSDKESMDRLVGSGVCTRNTPAWYNW